MSTPLRGSVLLVDDEEGILKTLGRALREEGHEVVATPRPAEAERLLAERGFDVLVVDNRMPGKTGLELIRDLVDGLRRGGAAPGHPDDRPRHRRQRDRGHEARGLRLPAEALRGGRAPGGGAAGPGAPAPAGPAPVPPQRAGGGVRPLRHHRPEPGDAGGDPDPRAGGPGPQHGADHRGDRHRQGARGAGDPRPQRRAARCRSSRSTAPPSPRPSSSRSCSGTSGGPSPAPPRTGGAASRSPTAGRSSSTRSAPSASRCRPSCSACSRRGSSSRWARERTEKVDVRVIAATNRDLRALVSEERFQEDLYYRLSVIPIELPPLRERREDIPPLVEHFVRKHAQRIGREIERIDAAALDRLRAYDWPGNVRELENTIERAVVLAPRPGHRRGLDLDRRAPGGPRRRAACPPRVCTTTSSGPSASRSAARFSRRAGSRRTPRRSSGSASARSPTTWASTGSTTDPGLRSPNLPYAARKAPPGGPDAKSSRCQRVSLSARPLPLWCGHARRRRLHGGMPTSAPVGPGSSLAVAVSAPGLRRSGCPSALRGRGRPGRGPAGSR